MNKNTNKTKRFPSSRRMDQDGSYSRCRAKTWGNDPRHGNSKRGRAKDALRKGNWDIGQ